MIAAMKNTTAVGEAKPKSIGILGFDGLALLDLAGPLEALTAARMDADGGRARACYDARILGVSRKTFISEANVIFTAKTTLQKAPDFDTVIIPGGVGVRSGETLRRISEWLATHASRLKRVVSICTGIYPLGQSGLLDGRKVATHWRFAQDIARRFPRVSVDPAKSFIKDGPFYTCGGGTAAIELTLALIEEDYGPRVALSVAREFAARLRPLGDSESYLDSSQFECGPPDRLAELPAWISTHLDSNLSVEALAERACVCYRHFTRLFKRLFRTSPANFVETLRIGEARRRLVLTHNSVETVAAAVGFKSPDSFRRVFQRRVGLSPAAFRRTAQKSDENVPVIRALSLPTYKTKSSEKKPIRVTTLPDKLSSQRRLSPVNP
jgi:transcriptional regulator GlxA family with amidase domain